MLFQKSGSVGLQSTFSKVTKDGVVAGVESGPVYVRFLLVGAALEQVSVHRSCFCLYFRFLHIILVSPLPHTFNILPPLFAAAPSSTTDAYWETGEFERKKKIMFLVLKSVHAYGNS
jgi:hypothetical protein